MKSSLGDQPAPPHPCPLWHCPAAAPTQDPGCGWGGKGLRPGHLTEFPPLPPSASTVACGYDSAGESGSGHFPLPSPLWEASPFELVAQKPAEAPPKSGPESGLSSASDREATCVHPARGVNGMVNGRAEGGTALPSPPALLSPVKEPPPLLAKPKL